ncbi:MAG TPA: PAS domain S-box protein [Thermoanaerobaculia bacterium]|nr:PAS domain S-box protein [Thermoanaerobaculia bacterium]
MRTSGAIISIKVLAVGEASPSLLTAVTGTTTVDVLAGSHLLGVTLQQTRYDLVVYALPEDSEVAAAICAKAGVPMIVVPVRRVDSDEHYQLLFENSHDAVLVFDPSTEIVLEANPRAHELYGVAPGELVGRSLYDFSTEVAGGRRQITELFTHGGTVAFSSTQKRADGRPIDIDIRAALIPFHGRMAVLTANRDVTEQRAATDALRASQERYRELFERATIGIVQTTLSGEFLTVNPRAAEMLGLPDRDALRTFNARDLYVDPEVRDAILAELLGGATSVRRELRLRRADGGILWAFVNMSAARGANGHIEMIEAYVTDLTDQMIAEQQREELARSLRLLLESTYEGICAADTEGRCTLINAAASRMFGYPPSELIGRSLHAMTHARRPDGTPYPAEECIVKNVITTREPIFTEDTFWRSNGESFPVEMSVSPIVDDGKVTGVVTSFRDVSRRKSLERQLETAERVAGLGRIAATIAHEFNNVLMAILPMVEILERRMPDERTKSIATVMRNAIGRGKRITEEILRFTRRGQATTESVSVADYLRDLGEQLKPIFEHQQLLIELPSEPLHMQADAHQLQQVFVNLAANARDALPRGGMFCIRARREKAFTEIRGGAVANIEQYVHFEVKDDGRGMDDATRRRIFEPLFTTKEHGTGIGLAVAHQILEEHGGLIFVDSAPGAGTTFHLFVPLSRKPESPIEAPLSSEMPQRALRILLVEDDEAVADALSLLLTLDGHSVEVVRTGARAEGAVERVQPELVILDLGLPDMDGSEVYRGLAARWPELPVVFASGHGDAATLDAFLQQRHVTFLMKPFELPALHAAIRDVTVSDG